MNTLLTLLVLLARHPASQASSRDAARLEHLYAEVSAANADFKKMWESTLAFRNDQYLWWQVAEYTYDTYLIRNRTRV